MNNAEKIRALLRKAQGTSGRPNGGIAYTTPPTALSSEASPAQAQAQAQEKVTLAVPDAATAKTIEYNTEQRDAIATAVAGQSCVITGAAGTGKTTTTKGIVHELIQRQCIGKIPTTEHKHLVEGSPSIAFVSFTNKAVQNLKKALPTDLRSNCMTIHKLLEYEPDYFMEYDPDTGEDKKTMRFLPKRDATNPLPKLDVIVIDESTMVSVDQWNTLVEAIPGDVQILLLGDIHQLPPVFGKSIFIWAMQTGAKVIELTHVYRQALQSPIISLAHRIRQGKQIPQKELDDFSRDTEQGKVFIRPWKKKLGSEVATIAIGNFLASIIDDGSYDPMKDVILTPFNKSFGTIAMNAAVASHLATRETDPEKAEVWEVFAGINKKYFRIGEKVLHNKTEAFITKIEKNRSYYGKMPRVPSNTMDYNGIENDTQKRILNSRTTDKTAGMESDESIEAMLEHLGSHTDDDTKVSREASHKITVYMPDLDTTAELSGSGDIGKLDLGYALTVHKSQGSEYDRVFFITHGSQSNMFFRELLYTAVTRAAKELYVICESNFFVKGVVTQRVPGNTLEDKIVAFNRNVELSKTSGDEVPNRLDLLVCAEEQEVGLAY